MHICIRFSPHKLKKIATTYLNVDAEFRLVIISTHYVRYEWQVIGVHIDAFIVICLSRVRTYAMALKQLPGGKFCFRQ